MHTPTLLNPPSKRLLGKLGPSSSSSISKSEFVYGLDCPTQVLSSYSSLLPSSLLLYSALSRTSGSRVTSTTQAEHFLYHPLYHSLRHYYDHLHYSTTNLLVACYKLPRKMALFLTCTPSSNLTIITSRSAILHSIWDFDPNHIRH